MAAEIHYSPLAEARWVHLLEPRPQMDADKPLAWSLELLLPIAAASSRSFLAELERGFVEAHGRRKRRSDKGEPWKPDRDQPDELMVVRFKAQQLQRRDGSFSKGPRVIDARKQPWDGGAIGNGSRLVVAFTIHPWDRPEGVGITLIPRAAQVVHFVPYQECDPTEGFEEQEGYSQADAALAAAAQAGAAADGGYDEFGDDEEVPF